jgi:glutamine amidotransferase
VCLLYDSIDQPSINGRQRMCELFAMCARNDADVSISLAALAEHGNEHAPHKDGWGIAYYEGNDVRVIRRNTANR